MNIRIDPNTPPIDLTDRVAKCLYLTYNYGQFPELIFDGFFTKPYLDSNTQYSQEQMDKLTFYGDNIDMSDPQAPKPQIYGWREWGFRAQQFLDFLHQNGLSLSEVKQIDS